MSEPESPVNQFIDGQKDCQKGVPHEAGKSKDYDRGYEYEYWRQERQTAISEGKVK